MGLYRAVGKPLFFALPPETAHHLALALLGLPEGAPERKREHESIIGRR